MSNSCEIPYSPRFMQLLLKMLSPLKNRLVCQTYFPASLPTKATAADQVTVGDYVILLDKTEAVGCKIGEAVLSSAGAGSKSKQAAAEAQGLKGGQKPEVKE